MTIEKLRELYGARPFRPFVMHLADGREIPVHHPEYMASAPSGRTVVIYQPDDALNINGSPPVGPAGLRSSPFGSPSKASRAASKRRTSIRPSFTVRKSPTFEDEPGTKTASESDRSNRVCGNDAARSIRSR